MRKGLKVPVSTALILTAMVATIAAGPGRAGPLRAAGFAPIQAPAPIQVDITGLFWGR